jgi:hypothetical protein
MSKSMNCPSCGAPAAPEGSAQYIACGYCGTTVSVSEFLEYSLDDIRKLLEDLGLSEEEQTRVARLNELATQFIQSENYEYAETQLIQILQIIPNHPPSHFNLALCIFNNRDIELTERVSRVHKTLSAVARLDEPLSPEMETIRESIAYNMAAMGIQEQNINDAFPLFSLSRQILSRHERRDADINNYLYGQLTSLEQKVTSDIKRTKELYMPNKTTLDILLSASEYSEYALALLGSVLSIPAREVDIRAPNHQSLLIETYLKVKDRLPHRITTYSFTWMGTKPKDVAAHDAFQAIDKVIEAKRT